jgi:hypothetical protein
MKHLRTTFFGLLIGLLLASAVISTLPASGQATVNVLISSPADGSNVGSRVPVEGTATDFPCDQSLWLVVYSYKESLYRPQDGPFKIRSNGEWISNADFGNVTEEAGLKFKIIPVLANESINQLFNEKKTDGLKELPDGTISYQSVTVTRDASPPPSPSRNEAIGVPGFDALLGIGALVAVAASLYAVQLRKRR